MGERGVQVLDRADCLRQLALGAVGRIAFCTTGFPMVLPVNYRLVDHGTDPVILIRTSRSSAVADAPLAVAFEVDGMDPVHQTGWSVLVQGALRRLRDAEVDQLAERGDPRSWIGGDLDVWLAITPVEITGRRLVDVDALWSVDVRAYL
jgi:uncharacterized protein